jgi:mRNA-degrading endonuclease YafQ of YafQ-DinJ toxin-antitoxin module
MANSLRFTKYFAKKLAKLIKNKTLLKTSIRNTLYLLEQNEFDPRLRTHKVIGRQVGECYSSRVTGDIRILWKRDKEDWIILDVLDIGGHSGGSKVYK